MEITTSTDASFPEEEDKAQSSVPQAQISAGEQENGTQDDAETDISLETRQQEQLEGAVAPGACEGGTAQNGTDEMAQQGLEPDAARQRPRRSARWFQVLVVLLVISVVGGVVLTVQALRSPQVQGHVGPHIPAPVVPWSLTRWCVTSGASIDPQAGQVTLTKVVAFSSDDAWILGSTSRGDGLGGNDGRAFPLLEHWNGKTWTRVPTADTSALIKQMVHQVGGGQASESVMLNDLAVLSGRSIWAVGNITVQKVGPAPAFTPIPNVKMIQSVGQPLIEHWDGTAWQIVANPHITSSSSTNFFDFNRSGGTLSSISVIGANDIWAVGSQPVITPPTSSANAPGGFIVGMANGPLVEHWNGAEWKIVHLPSSLQHDSFLTIQALSDSDIWASSMDRQFLLSTFPLLGPDNQVPGMKVVAVAGLSPVNTSQIVHWNGQAWSTMSLPRNVGKKGLLLDVRAITDTDVWAISLSAPPDSKHSGLEAIEHWDGQAWSTLTGWPHINAQGTRLEQITVIGPENVWITGSTSTGQPLMAHWNGTVWKQVVPTSPAYGSTKSLAVAGQRAWALVDEQQAPANQKTSIASIAPETIGEVIETNC